MTCGWFFKCFFLNSCKFTRISDYSDTICQSFVVFSETFSNQTMLELWECFCVEAWMMYWEFEIWCIENFRFDVLWYHILRYDADVFLCRFSFFWHCFTSAWKWLKTASEVQHEIVPDLPCFSTLYHWYIETHLSRQFCFICDFCEICYNGQANVGYDKAKGLCWNMGLF